MPRLVLTHRRLAMPPRRRATFWGRQARHHSLSEERHFYRAATTCAYRLPSYIDAHAVIIDDDAVIARRRLIRPFLDDSRLPRADASLACQRRITALVIPNRRKELSISL